MYYISLKKFPFECIYIFNIVMEIFSDLRRWGFWELT